MVEEVDTIPKKVLAGTNRKSFSLLQSDLFRLASDGADSERWRASPGEQDNCEGRVPRPFGRLRITAANLCARGVLAILTLHVLTD
jgi:hypothetical protein